MTSSLNGQLDQGLAALGLDLGPEISANLIDFIRLLLKWNRRFSLTAVREAEDAVVRHLLDSLATFPFLRHGPVVDVGTGAGLPGIPLALADPSRLYVLVDSNAKKIRFVRQAVLSLGLGNVEVVHRRIEDYRPPEGFGTVISRAFSDLAQFVRLAGHLCNASGRLLAMKGTYPHRELDQVPASFSLVAVHPLAVPGLEAERHLVELAPAGNHRLRTGDRRANRDE